MMKQNNGQGRALVESCHPPPDEVLHAQAPSAHSRIIRTVCHFFHCQLLLPCCYHNVQDIHCHIVSIAVKLWSRF